VCRAWRVSLALSLASSPAKRLSVHTSFRHNLPSAVCCLPARLLEARRDEQLAMSVRLPSTCCIKLHQAPSSTRQRPRPASLQRPNILQSQKPPGSTSQYRASRTRIPYLIYPASNIPALIYSTPPSSYTPAARLISHGLPCSPRLHCQLREKASLPCFLEPLPVLSCPPPSP
jgi:hypothetical protein